MRNKKITRVISWLSMVLFLFSIAPQWAFASTKSADSKKKLTVSSSDPADSAVVTDLSKPIVIRFNKEIRAGKNYDKITIKRKDKAVTIKQKTIKADTLTLTPKESYTRGAEYTVQIPSKSVIGVNGQELQKAEEFTFKTSKSTDTKSLSVLKTDPADEKTNVSRNASVTVTFSKPVVKGDTFAKISMTNRSGKSISFDAKVSGSKVILTPKSRLAANTTYTVALPAKSVKDEEGNELKKTYDFIFVTEKTRK
ncbi:hypothetical protein GTO89_11170 [Heliobacterium gestii]|uniref:SbsA Ig-like domain-containing protein n=1 Tax=Heliomicrobium gestii TaxID=2699 RepID=A0A845LAC8_HELGE|nr:Ig-like domain-containing protein [Heliomicrobium gestii]MBM7867335.1 methionine-rich copper-binding protein CopC [Heliomicrobium gestii]MZP43602.1 hypothetical protein [Heliomicrobium gestii]